MKRIWAAGIVVVYAAGAAGCKSNRDQGAVPAQKMTVLADAVKPEVFAAALKKLGGAHFHATAKFAAGPSGAALNAVTTTTDVWMDRAGNYRIVEQNDRDGGREVVLHGRELAVALRYGKMIRRIAEEPEPSRLLEEALGAPFAVFDLVARKARVTRAGTDVIGGSKAAVFELKPSDGAGSEPGPDLEGLRKWRNNASIDALAGRIFVDDATGALMRCDLTAKFATTEGDQKPVQGNVEVHAVLSEVASTQPIQKPAAEDLTMRQRTLPEQRELLRGLGQARAAAEPPRPGARPARPAAPGANTKAGPRAAPRE